MTADQGSGHEKEESNVVDKRGLPWLVRHVPRGLRNIIALADFALPLPSLWPRSRRQGEIDRLVNKRRQRL